MTFEARIAPLLAAAVDRGELSGVAVTVESSEGTRYEGAAGTHELGGEGSPFAVDTPLRIASMTKAITSTALMQLVERGQVDLDAPASRWVPQLEAPQVLEADGALRPARGVITPRLLLTHTSGFGYTIWNDRLHAYLAEHPLPPGDPPGSEILGSPLIAEPGAEWNYSISTDFVGEIVRAVSGQSLGDYFAEHIFGPLGMSSTAFDPPEDATVAPTHARQADGSLSRRPDAPIPRNDEGIAYQSGGGGLYSTPRDYGRFLRMILGRGALDGVRILGASTVDDMATSHTGDLPDVGMLTSANLAMSRTEDMSFGHAAGFGLGFLITLETSRTGRSAGSLSWGGLFNSYYWIDLERDVAGACYTQVLPFLDRPSLDLAREFEHAVYETLDE